MLRIESHGDVTRLVLTSRASRSVGYSVSAYATRGVLVDTGFPKAGADLESWLRTHPVAGAIVTHHHEDHAGNVERLARRGLPLLLHAETEAMLRAPKPVGLYRRYTWGAPVTLRSTFLPFAHDALELLPARGHSPDHHVVWDAERETIFGGDLFIGVRLTIAHPGEDIRGQVRALRAIAALRPKRFFDAHRGPLDRPVDLLRAKADWMEGRIAQIERRAAEGWSAHAIRDAVLGARDVTGWFTVGDYSRMNFVRSVLDSTSSAAGQ